MVPLSAPFDASVEHYPMSGLDEFLIHNHPHPVRVMWTSDAQAYERMWFTSHDTTGDLLVVAGMGIYPNLGTAEAFAIVNVRGRHTTVRAHRKLGLNRMDMTVGPLGFELVEPFRQWRLTLDENEFGTAFDLSWFDTKRPVYRLIGGGLFIGTKPFAGVAGYDGFGRQSGWVTAHGERFEVDRRDTGAPATTTGALGTGSAGRPCGAGTSIPTPGSGWSSRSTACGATTSSTTWATPAGAATPSGGAATGCASSPTPTCSPPARWTWSLPTAPRRP